MLSEEGLPAATRVLDLHVSKEDFKFSSAHFSCHGGTRERLHGHNYAVSVHVQGTLGDDGVVVDFSFIKAATRALCRELDEKFLCATASREVLVTQREGQVELRVPRDGSFFSFPAGDCVLLPLRDSTVEELAVYLAERLARALEGGGSGSIPLGAQAGTCSSLGAGGGRLLALTVGVRETPGQEARYTLRLASPTGVL